MGRKRMGTGETQRQKIHEFVDSLKTPCVKCGEHRLYIIDFHHVDTTAKEYEISRIIREKGRKTIEREIKKCICLCRNCHTEFHHFYGVTPHNPQEDLQEYLRG